MTVIMDQGSLALSGGADHGGHFVPPPEFVNHTGLSSESASSNSEKGLYTGLGLGTAGDITMIHSEILQYSQHFKKEVYLMVMGLLLFYELLIVLTVLMMG